MLDVRLFECVLLLYDLTEYNGTLFISYSYVVYIVWTHTYTHTSLHVIPGWTVFTNGA